MATALAVSPYGPQQDGELAAGFLLSSTVPIAVVGAVVYYYGPRLWQHIVSDKPPEEAAWQPYLDDWKQETGVLQEESDDMMGRHAPRR